MIPSEPIVTPTVTKTFIIPRRLAPMVRRIAMSRVFARTSMISDDSDVEHGDQDDERQDDEHRDPLDLQRLEQGRVHLPPVDDDALAAAPAAAAARGSRSTLSGLLVWISIMPTWSPSISRSCASCIGMTTNALS